MTVGECMLLCVEGHQINTDPNTYPLCSLVITFTQFSAYFSMSWFAMLFFLIPLLDDLNVPGIVAGIVILCLIICLCTLGVCYAHRQGYFNRKFTKTDFYYTMLLCRATN